MVNFKNYLMMKNYGFAYRHYLSICIFFTVTFVT
jgi:hypothetical protein